MGYLGVLLIGVFAVLLAARIGAFALELTGMEPETAKFQALSAFTGTGFTTSEAERVVRNRSRRRIITILILVGAAGLVTVIGTMAATFVDATGYRGFFIRLGIIVVVVVILYRVIMMGRVGNWVAHWFQETADEAGTQGCSSGRRGLQCRQGSRRLSRHDEGGVEECRITYRRS